MARWIRIFDNVAVRLEHISGVRVSEGLMIYELLGGQTLSSYKGGFRHEDVVKTLEQLDQLENSSRSPGAAHRSRMASQEIQIPRRRAPASK